MTTAARLKTSHFQVRIRTVYLLSVIYHLFTSRRSFLVEVLCIPVAGSVFQCIAFPQIEAETSPHQHTPRQPADQIHLWLVTFMLAGAATLADIL